MEKKTRQKVSDDIAEYIKYSIKKEYPLKQKWIFDMFAFIAEDEYEDDYVIVQDGQLLGKVGETDTVVLSNKYKDILLDPKMEIDIEKDLLPNVEKNMTTTVGRLIINYILIAHPFGNKIPYFNKEFTGKDIEKIIRVKLVNVPKKPDDIVIDEYHEYLDAITYIEGFTKLLSLAATPKSILPPPGLKEFKKKAIEQLKKKYGPKALENITVMSELEQMLADYDAEYLKGDEADGKLLSGKVKGIARKRMYLTFGVGTRFDDGPKVSPNLGSLEDGWNKDPKELSNFFNDSRAGSYGRGAETQQGGVVAKNTLRATSDIKVKKGDCGSKMYETIVINNENKDNYIDNYIIEGNGVIRLTADNINKYLNKTVKLRSPLYCKMAPHFCTTCIGETMSDYENGISLLASGIGGTILDESLKKFHGSALSTATVTIEDIT